MLIDTDTLKDTLSYIKRAVEEAESSVCDARDALDDITVATRPSAMAALFVCSRCSCQGSVPPYVALRLRGDCLYCEKCYEVYFEK